MKKLLLLILLPFITFAQQQEMIGELRIALTNYGSSWDITFTLTAIGARWDENFELTEDYETVSVNIREDDIYADFDHILDPSDRNPEFAVGLYKISAIENGVEQAYFYMDWRTSDWSASLDVSFKYDVGNKRFRDWLDTQTIDYSYQTLWDLTGNLLVTSGLEDYWNNCLAVFNNGSNRPKFVWGPYPTMMGITNYEVYRDVGTGFSVIATLNSDTYTYTDNSVRIDDPGITIYYKVKPVLPSRIPLSFTNTVSITVTPFKRGVENKSSSLYTFSLDQNYPNPFNPATTISFSVAENSFITLKVYDVLGKEVMTLINEMLEAGVHQVEFNGSGLKSGVYFYEIRAKNFRDVKKLILLK